MTPLLLESLNQKFMPKYRRFLEVPYNERQDAENWLREGMVVFDTVYNPERTLLIKQARERDCRTITGVESTITSR